jgi:hypothetical protein
MAPYNRLRLLVPIYSRHEVAECQKANVEVTTDGRIKIISLL